MPVETRYVGEHKVSVLRDSGCRTAVVKRSLVKPYQFTGNYQHCILIDGTVRKVEAANIYVGTPFYEGQLEVLCMEQPIYDLIIGNTHGVRDTFVENIKTLSDSDMAKQTGLSNNDQSSSKATVEVEQGVQMRFQEEKEKGKIKRLEAANQIADITPMKIKEAQNGNETFSIPIRIAESDEKKAANNGSIPRYVEESSILYREYQSEDVEHGKLFKQSVVPKEYRQHSLRLENDTILSEHLGITQVTDKIQSDSHWPVVQQENIRYYCSSCDVCKRTFFKGKILKVPIIDMPLIQVDTPFVGSAIVRLFLTILVIIFLAVVYLLSITMEKQNVFVFLIRGILSHICDSFETTHNWDTEF